MFGIVLTTAYGDARLCFMARKIDSPAKTPCFSQQHHWDRCNPLGCFFLSPVPWAPKNGLCGRRNRVYGDGFTGISVSYLNSAFSC